MPSKKLPAKRTTTKPKKGEHKRTAGSGRKKGKGNSVTRDMREMVWQAFENKGGVDYLTEHADLNPKAFISLLNKMIPQAVEVDPTDAVKVADRMREARKRIREQRVR